MAYSDYGAFVYCNGERRKDKEDSPLFSVHKTDWTGLCHGCMGDGDIRVMCYKQGLPSIYEVSDLGESAYTCEGNMVGWILPDDFCSHAKRKNGGAV